MTTILAHITLKPGMQERFEAMARPLFAASHANEPGLLRYEYWRGHTPGTYYTLLAFRDYAAFMEHQASDHHSTLTQGFGEMIDSFRLEFVDPITGASPLPPTGPGPLSANPSPLMEHYAERYPADVQPWWAERRTAATEA